MPRQAAAIDDVNRNGRPLAATAGVWQGQIAAVTIGFGHGMISGFRRPIPTDTSARATT